MLHTYLLYTFAEFKFKSNHRSSNVNIEWLKFSTFSVDGLRAVRKPCLLHGKEKKKLILYYTKYTPSQRTHSPNV